MINISVAAQRITWRITKVFPRPAKGLRLPVPLRLWVYAYLFGGEGIDLPRGFYLTAPCTSTAIHLLAEGPRRSVKRVFLAAPDTEGAKCIQQIHSAGSRFSSAF